VCTLAPRSRSESVKARTSGSATALGAVACHFGRRAFAGSAYSVEWLCTRSPPPAREDAKVEDLSGQGGGARRGIGVRDARQDQQARGGQPADRLPGYRYPCRTGTLNYSSHEKAFFRS